MFAGNLTQISWESIQYFVTAKASLQPHAYSFDVAETAVEKKIDPKSTDIPKALATCENASLGRQRPVDF